MIAVPLDERTTPAEPRPNAPTLVPPARLLERVVQLLEQDVLPLVAGRPHNATADAIERLRAIASSVQEGDDLPHYCAEAGCQNLAVIELCAVHVAEPWS